jgi:anti-sigma B factor antagonist
MTGHDHNDTATPPSGAPARAPSGFSCEVREEEEGSVSLVLGGELDIASAPMLEARFAQAVAVGAPRVVVDLRGLEFIDSTGLRVLLALGMPGPASGQPSAEFVPGPPVVQRVFELAGVADRLHFVADR